MGGGTSSNLCCSLEGQAFPDFGPCRSFLCRCRRNRTARRTGRATDHFDKPFSVSPAAASTKRLHLIPGKGKKMIRSRSITVEEFESEALPHLKRLYQTAAHVIGDRTEAEDLVQQTYLQAWKAFDRF